MMPLETWGGVECTVNRVGDRYFDQLHRSGHQDRPGDIDRFADLGIAALRFPVLWERVRPAGSAAPDWTWSDTRLARLQARGVRPIVGLVHHGSGPASTHLLDDGFAAGLAGHAAAVAERYPWIRDWTPVNEPLTTARFSGLYGHWYPHRRDERSFWQALLTQVDGTRAAMRVVRRVNAHARLIQTDDLGRTYATVRMAEQAAFDNLRRWAGWDLLFGRVTPQHPLWARLAAMGLDDRLCAIADDPCPPDVVGVNHYLTSDRFLDHRIERYPAQTHGSNGRIAYADTEALRALDPAPAGLAGVLREAWQRYGTTIAVTEVHNGCTREEQLRWAAEAWDSAMVLRGEGIAIEAVTAWALLGSHDWNTLLTAPGRYETGVFDVATGAPRPTALAALWRGLPEGAPRHPVARQAGWWRRPDRLLHRPLPRPAPSARAAADGDSAPLLICGATGLIGQAFARACAARGIHCVIADRVVPDAERRGRIAGMLDRHRPWGVVNATGSAEGDMAAGRRADGTGAIALATACADRGIGCLSFSSDRVFDGTATQPYVETDAPRPLDAHGRATAAMERACVALPGGMVVRTAALFSPFDPRSFVWAALDAFAANRPLAAADDRIVTPTFVPAMVDAALDLFIDGAAGVWHLAGGRSFSPAAFGEAIAVIAGHDPACVTAVSGTAPDRPASSALGSVRTSAVGNFDRDIAEVVDQHRQWSEAAAMAARG